MKNFLKYIAFTLVVVGALNWGFVGAFDFDLVAYLFGQMSALTRIIYILVGISAIVSIIMAYLCRKNHQQMQ